MRSIRRASIASAALALFALLATRAPADDVTTTAGKKINGTLVGVDAQGVTFATKDAKVSIPARDIVLVDTGTKVFALPKDSQFSEIELTDGSSFRFAKYSLKGKAFETELLPGPAGLPPPTYTLPMSSVFSAMKRADDPKLREAWKKMLVTRGKRDLYVIQQEAGFTFVQGTVLEGVTDAGTLKLQFEKEGGAKDTLLQSRAAGLVFYQAQPATLAPTLCSVLDVYGNTLNATSIAISADGVIVTTVAGATVKYPTVSSLVKLNYSLGNVAFLSDLDPGVQTAEVPADEKKLNPTVAYLKDRTLSNDSIRLDNTNFAKGLCVAPDTALTYNINGDYAQFRAVVGIDENGSNATSSAKVIIEADGQVVFAETLTRKGKPKGVVLAVKGVKQLKVIVEADTPFNGNYVTLAEARVQK